MPFTYWARLPDLSGTWSVTTDVRVGGASVAQQQGSLSVTQSGANLLSSAQVTTRLLGTSGSVGSRRASILSRLSQVQARSISRRSDVDQNLEELLFAAQSAAQVQGSLGAQVRQQLDHLILYWEARWYVY